jgi:hypothetical protein
MARLLILPGVLLATALISLAPAEAGPAARQSQRLRYGETQQGYLSSSGAAQTWHFTGRAGDLVLVDMRPGDASGLDTLLTLLDPAGGTIASDDDSGEGTNARIGPLLLRADGEYTVLADRYDGAGSYLLSLRDLNTAPELAPGKPVVGAVGAGHPSEYFLVGALARQQESMLRLTVRDDDPAGDPFLTVYGPDGPLVSTESGAEAGSLDPIVLEGSGPYVIIVTWNGETPGGAYELLLELSPIALLAPGEAVSGLLTAQDSAQRHYFYAGAGSAATLTLTAGEAIAPALTVATLDGANTLFAGDGVGTRALRVTLAIGIGGVYVVEVRDGAQSGESGAYTLTLEQIE